MNDSPPRPADSSDSVGYLLSFIVAGREQRGSVAAVRANKKSDIG